MINTIMTSIQAAIEVALPAYTRVDAFYTAADKVDSGDYPIAMIYDPVVASTRARERQKDQTMQVKALFIRNKDESVAMRDDLDAVAEYLETVPTLAASVDDARATDWGSAEGQQARSTGGMLIEVKLVG